MFGILVQLAISWLAIWLFEKRDLSVLGFKPTSKRLLAFFLFLLLTAIFCASGFIGKMLLSNQQWSVNQEFSFQLFLSGLWWNIKSVLFEELIFRGVLLYILIKKLGAKRAIIISAVAFGVYHWFSFGVIGNPMQMLIVFLITGTMGLLLAYAYSETNSLYIPIAIHLGWNFTQIFIFSQGPIGDGLFVSGNTEFRTDSYLVFFLITFLPMVLMLITNFILIKRFREPDIKALS